MLGWTGEQKCACGHVKGSHWKNGCYAWVDKHLCPCAEFMRKANPWKSLLTKAKKTK